VLDVSPDSLNFGDKTTEGKKSKAKSVTLKDGSSKKSKLDVTVTGESITGPGEGAFTITEACTNKLLGPGKKCKVKVIFTAPENTTPQDATLMITDDAVGSPQMVSLTGTGKPPKVKKK